METMFSFPKLILKVVAAFSLLITNVHSLLKLPENVTIPAVFIFGDSIVDTGNNNDLDTIVKANFQPYGRDFQGGKPTGRFSNGVLPSDIVVSELGIKDYLPPYLDPALQDKDLLTGVCFASSGVGFDPLTPRIVSVKSLNDQLRMFEEYKTRIQKIVGVDRANNFIVANSLYILAAGTNDIVNTYFHLSFRSLQYTVDGYTDLMANSATEFLKKLYHLGARRIAFFSIPSIGCTPSQRTLYGGIQRVCADICDKPARHFNSKIQKIIDSLNKELSGVKLAYMDGYNALLDIIHNKEKYGFKYADVGCCGTGLYEVSFMCNRYNNMFSCKNASEYVFWDSYHPTERTYRVASQTLLPELIATLFPTSNNVVA